MAETAISTAADSETLVGDPPSVHPSSDDLVAKGIAPVKPEYLLPPPPARPKPASGGAGADDDTSERKGVVKEKKSKRQAKRERLQEKKSALNICSQVAKKGSVDGCRYGANCRLSHDINAFLAMKPADMEGTCPFLNVEEPCPYGIACRFSGTHKKQTVSENENHSKLSNEINKFSKDLQKLLWKNKVSYPRAISQLKLLGLKDIEKSGTNQVGNQEATAKAKSSVNETACDSVTCAETDCVEDSSNIDDSRPLKKVKSPSNEQLSSTEATNGISTMEIDPDKLTAESGKEKILDDSRFSSGSDLASESHPREKKLIDFSGKLYLAPLTTVGNLPFRRVCKALGADITCGEMAMASNLLQGQASEWALLRRHSSEDIFGVQICGSYPDTIARAVELIDRECQVDFIDINMGCPIDIVVNKGAGSSLITHPMRMKGIIQAANGTTDKPITVKVRTGYFEGRNRIDALISDISNWGASAVTIHGRSRQQRYSKLADWDYIYECTRKAPTALQVIGNGDVFSFSDWNKHTSESGISTCMIARGALVKPWIFTEIKEQRDWDISSGERFNFLKDYVKYGLQHWGSDTKGVETTRHFLLEWLSYTYRYIPVGLLDVTPQRLNWRPPTYYGRDDLETLMASDSAADWVRISEMLLGKVPEGFTFAPKHKSNAYDRAENG